jgi:hypothetical protein
LQEDEAQEEIRESEVARNLEHQEQVRAVIVRTKEGGLAEELPEGVTEGATEGVTESVVEDVNDDGCPDLTPKDEDDDSDDEMEVDEEDGEEAKAPRRSKRIKQGVSKPLRYTAATVKLRESRHNEENRDAGIKAEKIAEIKQVFEELQALEPVEKEMIPKEIKPLGCHLFTVQKFYVSGEHKKYKSRLVLHGNSQDTSLYPDRSLPTVSMHMILMWLTLAACNSGYTLGKIDVKGAFIQTKITGTLV